MNKTRDTNVTGSLVLLIPALPKDEEGEAIQFELGGASWVRRFTSADANQTGKKLKGETQRHFHALEALKDALDLKHAPMLQAAMKRLEGVYRSREKSRGFQLSTVSQEQRQIGEWLSARIDLSPDESLKYWEGLRAGPRAMADPQRLFFNEVVQAVTWVHPTVWCTKDGKYWPALYCPYPETALYLYKFLMPPNGGCTWRSCPCCFKSFFQKSPNQLCLNKKHAAVYRQREWRRRNKTPKG